MEVVCASSEVNGAREAPLVRLMVVPVKVWVARSTRVVEAYAFVDEGSTSTLCTTGLQKALSLSEARVECSLSTMRNLNLATAFHCLCWVISMPSVLAIFEIPDLRQNIPTRSDVKKHPHLNRLFSTFVWF